MRYPILQVGPNSYWRGHLIMECNGYFWLFDQGPRAQKRFLNQKAKALGRQPKDLKMPQPPRLLRKAADGSYRLYQQPIRRDRR